MILNIAELGREDLQFDRALTIEDEDTSSSVLLGIEAARLSGVARREDRGVVLDARLTAEISVQCSRCIEPFSIAIDEKFSLTVVRELADETAAEGELELDEADLDVLEVPDGKVDLREIAREQIYLNLSLKPICKPDCLGLCVTCGGNRNRIECGCLREDLDPRLVPLLEFKKKMGDD